MFSLEEGAVESNGLGGGEGVTRAQVVPAAGVAEGPKTNDYT